jgi:hypothetical protein
MPSCSFCGAEIPLREAACPQCHNAPTRTSNTQEDIQRLIGGHRLLRLLGAVVMGAVYLAEDIALVLHRASRTHSDTSTRAWPT